MAWHLDSGSCLKANWQQWLRNITNKTLKAFKQKRPRGPESQEGQKAKWEQIEDVVVKGWQRVGVRGSGGNKGWGREGDFKKQGIFVVSLGHCCQFAFKKDPAGIQTAVHLNFVVLKYVREICIDKPKPGPDASYVAWKWLKSIKLKLKRKPVNLIMPTVCPSA